VNSSSKYRHLDNPKHSHVSFIDRILNIPSMTTPLPLFPYFKGQGGAMPPPPPPPPIFLIFF